MHAFQMTISIGKIKKYTYFCIIFFSTKSNKSIKFYSLAHISPVVEDRYIETSKRCGKVHSIPLDGTVQERVCTLYTVQYNFKSTLVYSL